MTYPGTAEQNDVAKTLGLNSHRSRLSRIFRWLIIIALLAGGGVYAKTRLGQEQDTSVQYDTKPVKQGDLVVTISATGTLEPTNEVEVGIEVSGTIETVEVDYNDQVKAGQVLARLDTSKLEAQALQSEAALKVANANLLQAKATRKEAEAQLARLKEVRELSGGKMPSQNEFDAQVATCERAAAEEASASASVSQAQANLDANRSDLTKAEVLSPIDGVVLERSIEPGQTVAAAFQSPILFTLAENLAQMELQVDVDEADVGQVREEQEATFTVDAYPDEVFPARTTQVRFGSETTDGVVTYKTILTVDNADLRLRPGMTATASIVVNQCRNAILVPNAALRFTPPVVEDESSKSGGSLLSSILPHPPRQESTPRDTVNEKSKDQHVWTLENGQLKNIPFTKGLSDGICTEVTEGAITPGMELVTDLGSTQ